MNEHTISTQMLEAIFWTSEEVANKAKEIYLTQIQQEVETPENIGKMLVVDVETGEYSFDASGVESALKLKAKRPISRLFMIKIGSDVAVSFSN